MRNGRKQKINHRVKNSFLKFLTYSIITILLYGSVAACLRPIPVDASISGTLAGLITTLVLSLGISPTSTAYTNALNSAGFNSVTIQQVAEGTYNAAAIDQAISSTGVDLSSITDILSTGANEATAINNAAGLTGSNAIGAASAGQNIAAAAENYVNTGTISIAQGGMAASVLNGTGALIPIFYHQKYISEKMQKFNQLVSNGLPQNLTEFVDSIPVGSNIAVVRDGKSRNMQYGNFLFTYYVKSNGGIVRRIDNLLNEPQNLYSINLKNNSTTVQNVPANSFLAGSWTPQSSQNVELIGYTQFADETTQLAYVNGIKNGTISQETKKSPDINTENGNATATYNPTTNNYTVNYSPTINYNTDGTSTNNEYITNVVNENDYNDYTNTVNNNTTNNDYESNGEAFQELVDTIKSQQNNDIINPDADTSTDIPVQPTSIPKPENTTEQNTENVSTMATVDLKDVFPFCIPWDLYNMISKFTANREAPEFNFTLNLGPAGNHEINIDFTEWESAATILRALELIVFIVGLAIATRNLIGS